MEKVIFKSLKRNAFIPPILFLLNIMLNRLLEIPRMMPGYHWIYTYGKMFSLFGIVLLGCIIFPYISFMYFASEGALFKNKMGLIYIAISFLPLLYFVLAIANVISF